MRSTLGNGRANCQGKAMTELNYMDRGDGVRIAYRHRRGKDPTIVFLPGYRSDMEGTKAIALWEWAGVEGRAMLRLDYSGCGASAGPFEDGTIDRWRDDVLTLIEPLVEGPVLLVGSSMGGWLRSAEHTSELQSLMRTSYAV